MKILFDTNVLLDVLLDREPFSAPAAALLSKSETEELSGYACATTITTIFYLCRKVVGKAKAEQYIRTLLSILDIAPVNRRVIERALQANFRDFEDAVLNEAALVVSADAIVTRNKKDFSHSTLSIYTPGALIRLLESQALPE